MTYLKSLLFLIAAPGGVGVLGPWLILKYYPPAEDFFPAPVRYAGLVLMALGVAGLLWCFWDFASKGRGTPAPIDPPKVLVVHGLYRMVRNPMYVVIVMALLGEALYFGAVNLFGYALLVWAIFNMFVSGYEEPVLQRQFGHSYSEYCEHVRRWWPRLRPYRPEQEAVSGAS